MSSIKILKASAGSGKTYKISYEYVKQVIIDPYIYRNILAVTFTNKATKEMKSRILEEIDAVKKGNGFLEELTKELSHNNDWAELSQDQIKDKVVRNAGVAQRNILYDYSNFAIMTIDKFFLKVFRAFCKELDMEAAYEVKLDSKYFLSIAIDNIIERYFNNPKLKRLVEQIIDERIGEGASMNFKKELAEISKKIFTKEFDARYFIDNQVQIEIFFKDLQKQQTTLKKEIIGTANELFKKITELSLTQEDFVQSSRGLYPQVQRWCQGDIVEPNAYVIKMLDLNNKWGGAKSKGGGADMYKEQLQPFVAMICRAINHYSTAEIILDKHRESMLLTDIATELDSVLKSQNVMLLSSSLKIITALINNNDIPYIYEKIGSRYEILMIDEFQDTSAEQWENFIPLIQNTISYRDDSQNSVTLVGDIKQSIYAWRGGDWRIFEYEAEKVAAREQAINKEILDTNWRSYPNIVKFNNMIIRHGVDALNSELNSMLDNDNLHISFRNQFANVAQRIYANMEQKIAPKNSNKEGFVELMFFEKNEQQNLMHCVEIIEDAQHRGFKPCDIAILVRNKREIPILTSFISQYKSSESAKSDISYEVTSRDGLLLQYCNTVNFIISCYKVSNNLKDTIAINNFNLFVNGGIATELSMDDRAFFTSLREFSICESFEMICGRYGSLLTKELAYVQALHDKIITFSKGGTADIRHFIEYYENESSGWSVQLPTQQNSIRIETIHAVKGLEFSVVIIPFCNWQLHGKAKTIWIESGSETPPKIILSQRNEKMANTHFAKSYVADTMLDWIENYNIFYVALTRAEAELYIMTTAPSKSAKKTSLQGILQDSFRVVGDSYVIISHDSQRLEGTVVDNRYTFGQKGNRSSDGDSKPIFMEQYNHQSYKNRIVLSSTLERYFDNSNENISARESGILKHRVFEKIDYRKDAKRVIEEMFNNSEIGKSQFEELNSEIEQIFQNPLIASWFDTDWEVRNENDILLFGEDGYHFFRPDRVVTNKDRAIVIDYKFGVENNKHKKQISQYKELLREMGYGNIKGYIWYITTGIVTEV